MLYAYTGYWLSTRAPLSVGLALGRSLSVISAYVYVRVAVPMPYTAQSSTCLDDLDVESFLSQTVQEVHAGEASSYNTSIQLVVTACMAIGMTVGSISRAIGGSLSPD